MCAGKGRDYWARFERFVKQLAWSSDDVYIVTGPLYVPQRTPQGYVMHHPMIGAFLTLSALLWLRLSAEREDYTLWPTDLAYCMSMPVSPKLI